MHQPMLGQQKRACKYCKQPLAVHIPASRDFCGDIACRASSQKDLIAIQDKKREDDEAACRTEVRKLVLDQASKGGFDPDELAVSELPFNPYDVAPVSAEARQALTDHLLNILDTLEDYSTEDVYREPLIAPVVPHLGDQLVTGCATCRGFCCLQGREHHAFLQRVTLKRALEEQKVTKEQLLNMYLEQIPRQSVEKGCLYQADDGCQLAPPLRSDICQDFYCEDMIDMMNRHSRVRPERHLIIATDKNRIMNATLASGTQKQDVDFDEGLSF